MDNFYKRLKIKHINESHMVFFYSIRFFCFGWENFHKWLNRLDLVTQYIYEGKGNKVNLNGTTEEYYAKMFELWMEYIL